MKKAIAVCAVVIGMALSTAVPAQAHYDPWTTHWHYVNGVATYKQCSWWDSLWGCKNWYNPNPIYLNSF